MNALLRRAPGRHQIISLKVTLDETWTEPEKDQSVRMGQNWSEFLLIQIGPNRCESLLELKMS